MTAVQMKMSIPGTGPAEGQGTSGIGTQVPAQDYNKLRRSCLQKGKLFEDPYFPADDRSLFFSQKLPFVPEWKRPHEIVKSPKLFAGGADRFDVEQGMLGDCWLVAAIASLTQDKLILKKVIPDPEGQDFEKGYAGIFRFRFWYFGEWVDIVIDDRLPTHNGRLIFIHSSDENEFWSALLEKAYAKLYGGFESLKGGKTSEAMTDFTGGVVEHFELTKVPDDLFNQMQRSEKRSSLMSCSIKAANRKDVESKLDNGLIQGHAYSVTGVGQVNVGGKTVQLIRVRNPWGQKEWNGDWSDESDTWKKISDQEKQTLQAKKSDDGEFWMSFDDFKKHFTDFEMCSVSIDDLYEDDNIKSWNSVVINGEWDAETKTAGGCRNFPTFTKNPQYLIDLKEDADGDGKCSVLIALMQKHRRKQKKMGVQDLCIGYSLYKAPDGASSVDKQYTDYNYSTGTSGSFTNAREVMKRFDLEPGRYIILPCAFKPGEEGDFLLRIFTETLPDEPANTPPATEAAGANPRNAKLYAVFKNIAGTDDEVDAEELQDLMTSTFSKDMGDAVFSLDCCRSMVALMDDNKNGTLGFEEFIKLLEKIGIWKRMFFKYDKDRSGTLERQEAMSAVRSLGYDISADAMSILFNRFAKKRRYMNVDDFIACVCRVMMMNDTFTKKSSGQNVTLSKDDFFKITLDA